MNMNWKVLSGFRFLLAWIVFCYHLRDFVPDYGKDFLCAFGKLNGLAAVLGFLLISGYSIANSITKEPRGFYQRRILRIYPLYLCGVILSLGIFLILGQEIQIPKGQVVQPDLGQVLGHLIFLQGFTVPTIQSDIPLWTISIEIFCYILAPLFIKFSNKILASMIFISAFLYTASPHVYHTFYPNSLFPFYNHWQYGVPLILFLWAWLLGFFYYRIKGKKGANIFLISLGFLVLVFNQNHTGRQGIITYLISSLALIYSPYVQMPRFLLSILNYLGEISYPLYLFHMPTLIFSYALFGVKSSITFAFLSLLISMFFYHAIDVPIRSRKFQKKKAGECKAV